MCLCKCHHGNIEGSLKEFQNRWEECLAIREKKKTGLSIFHLTALSLCKLHINDTANNVLTNGKGTKGTKG